MSNTENKTVTHKPLNSSDVVKLAGITNRLKQIHNTVIKTAALEEEAQVLLTTLGNTLLIHAAEFINAWLTVADEYMPLVNGFLSLQQRAANLAARRAQLLAEATASSQPSNIITPPDFKKE